MGRRAERLNGLLREEISRLLVGVFHDPRITKLVTVMRVDLSADLRFATVRVVVRGSAQEQRSSEIALRSATGFLRHELSQRLPMKYAPQLHIVLDESIEEGNHVLGLLDELKTAEARGDA